MTSNNDSRKRRRVTFEEDTEAPSKRGRVGGREGEEDHGPSLGRMNEGLSHGVQDDVSARHVDEVTGDDRAAPGRQDSGPAESPQQPPQDTSQSRRGAQDRDEHPHSGNVGHAGDGGHGDHGGGHASTGRTFTGGSTILEEGEVLSYIRRLAGGGTGINLDRDEGDADWAGIVGPYRKWPIGTLTAQAVLGLATGRAPPGSLGSFISNNMCYEVAMTQSPTAEVLSIHNPIKRPSSLVCDICNNDGTHSTGRCAMLTSDKHGDTNTDPFCDCSCSRAQDRHGNATHGLQRSQDSGGPRVQIVCPKLAAHWERGELGLLFQKFVVERRRMAPLRVYTKDFCFIKLAIGYSNEFCGGEMPEKLEGIWPYTRADAIKHKDQLRQFYEIGMENMPAGELEGLSMADIRARYDTRGGIPPQYRYDA